MRTLTAHLGEETLIDLLDGTADGAARAHVAECLHCRARLDAAAAGLEMAREADVPEPSHLYWEAFRRQVGRRIRAGEPAPWRRAGASPWLAAAAAVVALVALLPRGGARTAPAPVSASVLPAWSPLPPLEEDTGLELLAAVVPGTNGLGPLAECQGLADCMEEAAALTDQEKAALAEALRQELGAQS